jgi:hypothetical protein
VTALLIRETKLSNLVFKLFSTKISSMLARISKHPLLVRAAALLDPLLYTHVFDRSPEATEKITTTFIKSI